MPLPNSETVKISVNGNPTPYQEEQQQKHEHIGYIEMLIMAILNSMIQSILYLWVEEHIIKY